MPLFHQLHMLEICVFVTIAVNLGLLLKVARLVLHLASSRQQLFLTMVVLCITSIFPLTVLVVSLRNAQVQLIAAYAIVKQVSLQ
jgi:predicted neutral ceramidase superfamily lipid hydrolase